MDAINILPQMGIVAILSLIVGLTPAALGLKYALRPTESNLALMRPISLAAIFAALAGFIGGMINVLKNVPAQGATVGSSIGLAVASAESLVPLFVAFVSLTLAWLFVAVGLRRTA